jgi:hypothetical protein
MHFVPEKMEAPKLLKSLGLCVWLWVILLSFLFHTTDVLATVTYAIPHTIGINRMLYDYQRDRILIANANSLSILYPSNSHIEHIAGNGGYGCADNESGTSSSFNNINAMTTYHSQDGTITGYLIVDRSCYCLRHISASYPYKTTTVYGNCSDRGTTDGRLSNPWWVTTGRNEDNFIYAMSDWLGNNIVEFKDNENSTITEPTMSMRVVIPPPDHASETILYYTNKTESKHRDYLVGRKSNILYFANSSGYTYNYQNPDWSSIISIRLYGSNFLTSTKRATGSNIWYGNDVLNLERQPCSNLGMDVRDALVLPNGTVIQSSNRLYVLNCSLNPYNKSDLEFYIPTKSPSHSYTYTSSNTYTDSHSHSHSHSHTTSRNQSESQSQIDSSSVSHRHTHTHSDLDSISISKTHSSSYSDTNSNTPTKHNRNMNVSKNKSSITNKSFVHSGSKSMSEEKTRTLSSSVSNSASISITKTEDRTSSHSISSTHSENMPIVRASKRIPQPTEAYTSLALSVGGMIATTAVSNGARTIAFSMILMNDCGEMRSISRYENPLGLTIVAIGNLVFMFSICLLLYIFGYLRNWIKNRSKSQSQCQCQSDSGNGNNVNQICKDCMIYQVLYSMWFFYTPSMITSYFQYNSEWYEVISCIIATLSIFAGCALLLYGLLNAHKLDPAKEMESECLSSISSIFKRSAAAQAVASYFEEKVVWFGLDYIVEIMEGYTLHSSVIMDLALMILNSFIMLVDDCNVLAHMLITTNIYWLIFFIYTRSIQPLVVLYGTVIFVAGQTIYLLCYTKEVNNKIDWLLYITSVLGTVLIYFPFAQSLYRYFKRSAFKRRSNQASEAEAITRLRLITAEEAVELDDFFVNLDEGTYQQMNTDMEVI